jgi:hypothetical protein
VRTLQMFEENVSRYLEGTDLRFVVDVEAG